MKFKLFKLGCAATASMLLVAGCSAGSTPAASPDAAGGVNKQAPLYSKLPAKIQESGKMVMGSQLASPPVIYFDSDAKTIKGLIKDLGDKVSEEVGVPIEFEQISFASLTPSLQSGKIDGIFDMFADTKSRQETFDFVDYIQNGLTYLVAKGNPEGISTSVGLCGKRVSGLRGTNFVASLVEQAAECEASGQPKLDVQQFATESDARLQVQNGKSDAFLGQTLNMSYLAKTAGEGKLFDAIADESYPLETTGIVVAKNDNQLRDTLAEALRNIMADGRYATILESYEQSKMALSEPTINGGK